MISMLESFEHRPSEVTEQPFGCATITLRRAALAGQIGGYASAHPDGSAT
jgi:hypothetical protein